MTIRRRYPITPADYTPGDALERFEAIHCAPVSSDQGEPKRHRVDRDPPRLARIVAEIDEADVFRRTYIRPWPAKGDE